MFSREAVRMRMKESWRGDGILSWVIFMLILSFWCFYFLSHRFFLEADILSSLSWYVLSSFDWIFQNTQATFCERLSAEFVGRNFIDNIILFSILTLEKIKIHFLFT